MFYEIKIESYQNQESQIKDHILSEMIFFKKYQIQNSQNWDFFQVKLFSGIINIRTRHIREVFLLDLCLKAMWPFVFVASLLDHFIILKTFNDLWNSTFNMSKFQTRLFLIFIFPLKNFLEKIISILIFPLKYESSLKILYSRSNYFLILL